MKENNNSTLKERVRSKFKEGVLPASDASLIMAQESVDLDGLCEVLVDIAKDYAIAPISEFFVGAVIVGGSGSFYIGANYEFSDSFLNQSIHAEQAAVVNAYYHGEKSIKKIHRQTKRFGQNDRNDDSDALRSTPRNEKPKNINKNIIKYYFSSPVILVC